MPAYLISMGFSAKNQPKNRRFCMDFHLRKLSRKDYNQSLQESRTVPPDIMMGAFHLRKKPGNFGGSKSGISDW